MIAMDGGANAATAREVALTAENARLKAEMRTLKDRLRELEVAVKPTEPENEPGLRGAHRSGHAMRRQARALRAHNATQLARGYHFDAWAVLAGASVLHVLHDSITSECLLEGRPILATLFDHTRNLALQAATPGYRVV